MSIEQYLIDRNDLLVSGVVSLFVRIVVGLQVPQEEHVGHFLGIGQSHGVEVEPGETASGIGSAGSEPAVAVIDPIITAHDRAGAGLFLELWVALFRGRAPWKGSGRVKSKPPVAFAGIIEV